MTITFYEHPFASYVQKAKTAYYEKGIPFEAKVIDGSKPVASEFAAPWPTPPSSAAGMSSRYSANPSAAIDGQIPEPVWLSTDTAPELAGDLLRGADEIAEFIARVAGEKYTILPSAQSCLCSGLAPCSARDGRFS